VPNICTNFHNECRCRIIFSHSNPTELKDEINVVTEKISEWFQANSLILNFNKNNYI